MDIIRYMKLTRIINLLICITFLNNKNIMKDILLRMVVVPGSMHFLRSILQFSFWGSTTFIITFAHL